MRTLCAGLICGSIFLFLTANSHAAAVINELWVDEAGDANQFIELLGTPGESLDGLQLLVIDNDNGGNTASSAYRRLNQVYDLIAQQIPDDGYYVIGAGPAAGAFNDFPFSFSAGDLQTGSQTYVLVPSGYVAFEPDDFDQLTQASVDDIAANALDIVATSSGNPDDLFDFEPVLSRPGGVDAASRVPNGVDTDSSDDWRPFLLVDYGVSLGAPDDVFGTPGAQNVPEPTTGLLALLGLAAYGIGRCRR